MLGKNHKCLNIYQFQFVGYVVRIWSICTFDQTHCAAYQFISCAAFDQLMGSVKEPNMLHNYKIEKITRKASDTAHNLQLYRVVRFFHPVRFFRSVLPIVMHDDTFNVIL